MSGRYTGTGTKPDLDNHANQLNPNNAEYGGGTTSYTGTGTKAKSGGGTPAYTGTGTKADLDNHANQLNPNHSEYKGKPK